MNRIVIRSINPTTQDLDSAVALILAYKNLRLSTTITGPNPAVLIDVILDVGRVGFILTIILQTQAHPILIIASNCDIIVEDDGSTLKITAYNDQKQQISYTFTPIP